MLDLDRRLRSGPLQVGSVWTPDRSERMAWRALRRRRAIALSVAVACTGACIAGIYLLPPSQPNARPSPPSARAAQPERVTPRSVRFADGSIAELRGATADVQVEQQSSRRVLVRLTGGARFDVTPNRARSFEVRSGEVLVRVLGTSFSVDRHDARTRVGVERGRVQVSWASGSAILSAGEIGTFPPEQSAPTVAAVVTDAGVEPAAGAATEAARAPRSWRDWARKGDYRRAYRELHARPGSVDDEAADLMLAADVARLSAHPQAAVAPLRTLCERYPNDKRAPVAAFTLGRVLLDDLGRAAEAAEAFEAAATAWPSGPLAHDALARAVEAWQRADRHERARPLAERYLRRFPAGRHAAAMREALRRER
jgi:transmembrane sensor